MYITNTKKGTTPEMMASLPFIEVHIPVLALFKLLGIERRKEALDIIIGNASDDMARLLSAITRQRLHRRYDQ